MRTKTKTYPFPLFFLSISCPPFFFYLPFTLFFLLNTISLLTSKHLFLLLLLFPRLLSISISSHLFHLSFPLLFLLNILFFLSFKHLFPIILPFPHPLSTSTPLQSIPSFLISSGSPLSDKAAKEGKKSHKTTERVER